MVAPTIDAAVELGDVVVAYQHLSPMVKSDVVTVPEARTT
jgi:hypothetical protein